MKITNISATGNATINLSLISQPTSTQQHAALAEMTERAKEAFGFLLFILPRWILAYLMKL